MAGSTAKAASKAPQPGLGAAGLGAPTGPPVAAALGALAKELETPDSSAALAKAQKEIRELKAAAKAAAARPSGAAAKDST